LERASVDDVAIGVGCIGALVQRWSRRGGRGRDTDDAVVSAIAGLRCGEIGGGINGTGLGLELRRSLSG